MNESIVKNCAKIASLFLENLRDVEFLEIPVIINVFVNVVLTLTATLGNGMIIVAILRSQNLQTPSYLLITSLAFTDLLVGLVFHPLQITVASYYLRGNFQILCGMVKLFLFFSTYLSAASLLMVTCISIDRYLALTLRHRYTIIVTKKRVRLLIVVVWILSFLYALTLMGLENFYVILYIITFVGSFLLLCISCVFYIKSFRALHLYTVQVHAQQANPLAGNFNVVRYKKTLKTMLLVLVCLLLCYLPIVCALMLMNVIGYQIESAALFFQSLISMGLNSSINPIIYMIRFSDIRNRCREIFWNLFHRN